MNPTPELLSPLLLAQSADAPTVDSLGIWLGRHGIDPSRWAGPIENLGWALLATVAFVFTTWITTRVTRALASRIREWPWMARLHVRGFQLVRPATLVDRLQRLLAWLDTAIDLLAAYLWLTFVLTRFEATRATGEVLGETLSHALQQLATAVGQALPQLAIAVFILWLTRGAAALVDRFMRAVGSGSVKLSALHQDTAEPTRRIAVALTWGFGVVAAYPYLPGSQSEAFKGMSVLIGLVLSLGSSGVANQAMSGLVVMYTRAFRAGEVIRVGEVQGLVMEVGLLSTQLETALGEQVTVPNAVAVSTALVNVSRLRGGGVITGCEVTIGYDTPWRQVHAMLLSAARETPGIQADPAPFVIQTALDDFYVRYSLRCVTLDPLKAPFVKSALLGHVLDTFNTHGVQIMSPHFMQEPQQPAVVPPGGWYAAPASPPETARNEAPPAPKA